jgi:hypothetical protein
MRTPYGHGFVTRAESENTASIYSEGIAIQRAGLCGSAIPPVARISRDITGEEILFVRKPIQEHPETEPPEAVAATLRSPAVEAGQRSVAR